MTHWKRRAARGAMAAAVALTLVSASGLALAHGSDPGHGHGSSKQDAGPQGKDDFNDLAQVAYADPAIQLLALQGVLQGTGNGQFGPQGNATRAQMAVMLGRLLGWSSTASGETSFADAAEIPAWARAFVGQAAVKGIFKGDGNGRFHPGQQVTWDEVSVLIDRVFAFPPVPSDQISADLAKLPYGHQTPGWARAAVASDEAAGLFDGLLGQIYMPDAPVSRAELAVLLQRAEEIQPAPVAQANTVVIGTIAAINGTTSLTVNGAKGPKTVPLASGVLVYQAGSPVTTASLAVGQRVVIGIDATGNGALIEIVSGGAAQPGQTASGTVSAISSSQISITGSAGATTYSLAPNLTVTGKVSSLGAIVPGDQVVLTADSGGLVTSINVTSVTSAASTVSGSISAISPSSITLLRDNTSMTFLLASPVTVTGLASTLSSVAAGDAATLTVDANGTVTAIDVTALGTTSTTVSGTIGAVTATTLSIAESGGGTVTFPIAPGATVSGLATSVSALQPGDTITATISPTAQVTAIDVVAVATATTVSGSVVTITSNVITVQPSSGAAVTYALAGDVTVSGQVTSLGAVQPGDQVTLTINPVTAQVQNINVENQTGLPPATSSSSGVLVLASATTVTLAVYGQSGATLATTPLATGAKVSLDGATVATSALPLGDAVTLGIDAAGDGVSLAATSLGSSSVRASGVLVSNGATEVVVYTTSGQVTLATGATPVAISGGQVVALSAVALDSHVTAVSDVINGSLLLVVS